MNKTCKACKKALTYASFYKHPTNKDGYFTKCKTCIKKERKTYLSELFQTFPELKAERNKKAIESAKAQGKYPAKCSPEARRRATKNFATRWPEKVAAYVATRKLPKQIGYEHHHWSYNAEHYLDTILISKQDHYLIAKYLQYVPELKLYKRKDTGQLLATKALHQAFINEVISRRN